MYLKEIKAEKILSLTKISLSEYVINHYVGCQYGCLYCYVKYLKRNRKLKEQWGDFVNVKINSPELLRKELKNYTSGKVMLGSITEVYQPIEKKYKLTRQILEILVEYQIPVVILTKSDLILRDIDLLKKLPSISVFYTLSFKNNNIKDLFEKNSPDYEKRLKTISELYSNSVNVWVHFGPLIPYFNDAEMIIDDIKGLVGKIEFESLNTTTAPLEEVCNKLKTIDEEKANKLFKLYNDEEKYNLYWKNKKEKLEEKLKFTKLKTHFSFLPYNQYF